VKALALAHVEELDARIRELEAMKQTLQKLAVHCHGDDRPECPILDGLAAPSSVAAPRAARKDISHQATRVQKRTACH